MSTGAVIVAGGGTGGHLFPAVAVIEALGGTHRHWLCSDRDVDARILSSLDEGFTPLAARALSLRPAGLARFLAGWGPSVRQARTTIRTLRRTHGRVVVLSTGGFAAAPVVQAAAVERCPVHALVLDDPPGKATRWIMGRAHTIHDATLVGLRRPPSGDTHRVGPLIRVEARAEPHRDTSKAVQRWGLDPSRPVLLVSGGSLGASSLNDFVRAFAAQYADTLRAHGWQLLHQAGGGGGGERTAQLEQHYRENGIDARVEPMLRPMGEAWSIADLAICRAGASTVAEVAINGVPTVFMPYPHHRDRHQERNAAPLLEAKACEVWLDRVDPSSNLRAYGGALVALLSEPSSRAELSQGLASIRGSIPPDGPQRVAEMVRASLAMNASR